MTEPLEGDDAAPHVPVGQLLGAIVPAAAVGALCSLLLIGLSFVAETLQGLIWDDLSDALGIASDSPWWIVSVLTVTGVAVGLVVKYVPGHAGPDPATHGLVGPPPSPSVTPSLALALVLMLAGGVSLGPENPIMAINAALVVWLGGKVLPAAKVPHWVVLSTAGTIGAMFGTPVAAALMLSELDVGDRRIPLWDRLFAPLVAATAGSIVTLSLSDLSLVIDLPGYAFHRWDLLIALAVAVGAAVVGVLASAVFAPMHGLFHRLRDPLVRITVGGLLLGVLGAIGGPLSLFKGLDEMKELPAEIGTMTALGFLGLGMVKVVALLVASTAGFRGGRIFPAVFAGAAFGFAVSAAFPSVSLPLAVGAGIVGLVVAVSRSGWLSIFMALAAIPDPVLLPVLVLASLGAWLMVANRPVMIAPELAAEPRAPGEPDEPEVSRPTPA
ncbi:ion channel protein [Cellulomonas edaphi]|uniref:Ion channel protein n=1 Tax=Cellulomonas edaphi TaxID=3053468 RepID=A0ABT7S3X3_9CELL|nr:ion channel protein [Cellulomons edaphi]MDM7830326.1 ion channel protein [Cellulomons edaphi]